ncbi:WbqC family protein [Portibacter lacus]|uniref:WbqC-like protein family protein n=1 Tax=Portibacter lacus TaxID=1099794 RepID=A0AA37SJ82_9BACT|nr:WbqC family protein [Portibacter lacus]GLR15451.1 hypothetical protein GCM10007940_00660 [Portibacter lacus]
MPKTLLETQYFPSIAFFAFAHGNQGIIIDQHEHYHKGSYRNRTEIMSAQGRLALSVPLSSGKNNQLPIIDVGINNDENWALNHLRSIESCYGKSPYFEFYYHYFVDILSRKHQFLFKLNLEIIELFYKILGIEKKIVLTNKFIDGDETNIDLKRDFISPKSKYQDQLSQEFIFHQYDQVFMEEQPFEPNLSILDLIFCMGPEAPLYLAKIRKNK